jgi:hypothetical protein
MKMMNMYGMFDGWNGSGKNNTSGKYSGRGSGNDFIGNSTGSGNGSGRGMGMKMNMGTNATDDSFLQALEEDIIPGGKGGMYGVSGNSTGGGKGSMSTAYGDSNNGGMGAQRDKRGPEGLSKGMMMKSSDADSISSSVPPKSKRNMFRPNKNSTAKLIHNILHTLNHSNASIAELNHTLTGANRSETNSTIGSLMERFRMGLNQGFHHARDNTTSSNSTGNHTQFSEDDNDNENEGKFPRLSYIWDKLMDSMGSDSEDGNATSMIGTKLWNWFNEKN